MIQFGLMGLFGRDRRKKNPAKRKQAIADERAGGLRFQAWVETTETDEDRRNAELMRKLGYSPGDRGSNGELVGLAQILRPINNAISKTFTNRDILTKAEEQALQIAISRWDHLPNLPRFGPSHKWDELEDHGRPLSKEERMNVTYLAFSCLRPETFLQLQSKGVKKYKTELDDYLHGQQQ